MIVYDIIPVSFFKHNYRVMKDSQDIAYIRHGYKDFDKIILTENKETYILGGYRDVYQMGRTDGTIITAEKNTALRTEYNIRYNGREFLLKKTMSFLRKRYTIFKRHTEIGRIEKVSIFRRMRRYVLARDVPQEIILFMIWITIMLSLQLALSNLLISDSDF